MKTKTLLVGFVLALSALMPSHASATRALSYGDWVAVHHFPPFEMYKAASVQWCETNVDGSATDPDHEVGDNDAVGRFQITPVWYAYPNSLLYGVITREDLFDPEINGWAAEQIWEHYGWIYWGCQDA